MDAASYEDLAARLHGLVIMLEDQVGDDQAGLTQAFIEVGEYGLVLEGLAGEGARHRPDAVGHMVVETRRSSRC
jgi:hypothetical protein